MAIDSIRDLLMFIVGLTINGSTCILHDFDKFDSEKYCDLEIRIRGHSMSSKLVT